MSVPKVLLADDQEEMRQTMAHLLEEEFHVVGTFENGKRALEAVSRLAPDVLVLDICMPVMNGIEAAERLRDSGSAVKIILLSVHEDLDFLEAALCAGAVGYVCKASAAHDLVAAIHETLKGQIFVSPTATLTHSGI